MKSLSFEKLTKENLFQCKEKKFALLWHQMNNFATAENHEYKFDY